MVRSHLIGLMKRWRLLIMISLVAIKAFLSNIKNALLAGSVFVAMALYALLKIKSKQLDEAEDEIEAYELKDEITEKQSEGMKVILDEEQKEIDSAMVQNKKLSKGDYIYQLQVALTKITDYYDCGFIEKSHIEEIKSLL